MRRTAGAAVGILDFDYPYRTLDFLFAAVNKRFKLRFRRIPGLEFNVSPHPAVSLKLNSGNLFI